MTDPTTPPSSAPLASGLPLVQGRCPACGTSGLFLGSGGYVTCSLAACPEPDAASTLLERTPAREAAAGGTCDASLSDTGFVSPLGPCILRHGHDGPVHKDASGSTWWPTAPSASGGAR